MMKMTDREFRLAIKKYLDLNPKKNLTTNQFFKLKKEQQNLEQNPSVKKYLEIMQIFDLDQWEVDRDLLVILKSYGLKTSLSSEIYYYNGRFTREDNTQYDQYINIETREKKEDEQNNFKENHNVLISKQKSPSWSDFETLQNWYYKTLYTSSSVEEALVKAKKRCIPNQYNQNNK